jgi:heme a synthase
MEGPSPPRDEIVVRLLWALLASTVLVVIGGAVVRATGSGAGCGPSWPTCVGQIIPVSPRTATIIELAHRLATTALGVATVVVGVLVWRRTGRGDRLRRALAWVVGLLFVEALIGRTLVVTGWVGTDASVGRATIVPLHLVNTFFLLAAIAVALHLASGGGAIELRPLTQAKRLAWLAAACLVVVGASGALNALADTLFPAGSLSEGLLQDLDATAHFLVRLRTIHPVVAAIVGIGVLMLSAHPDLDRPSTHRLVRVVRAGIVVQLALGVVNIALLTPLAVQILHLLAADVIWVATILLATRVSSGSRAVVAVPS